MKKLLLTTFALCFILPQFVYADLTSNVQLHYKFDEGSGTTANDSAGSNNGTLNNGATYDTGYIGPYSMLLDGVNDYAKTNGNVSMTGPWSISMWIKPNGSTQAAFARLIESNFSSGFSLNANSGGTTLTFVIKNGSSATSLGAAFTNGTWENIVIVYDDRPRMYINGVVQTAGATGAFGTVNLPLYIGTFNGTPGNNVFKGDIDDVCVYTRALTSVEAADMYASTSGCSAAGPAPVSTFQSLTNHAGTEIRVHSGSELRVQ